MIKSSDVLKDGKQMMSARVQISFVYPSRLERYDVSELVLTMI
jgi:hypothetical protein